MDARLGTNELLDLLIAYVVLTIAFGIVFSGGVFGGAGIGSLRAEPFIVSAIGVGTGFILHELAHKFAAQRYGYQAAFKADMNGLFLTIIMSVMGFIIAMPGAVMIGGRARNENNYEYRPGGSTEDDEYWDHLTNRRVNNHELVISIAGVVVNLLIVLFFIALLRSHFVPWHVSYYGNFAAENILAEAAFTGMQINIVLAAFNMIPFGPLDGAKVLRANPIVWAIVGLPVIFGWLMLMTGNAGLFLNPLLGI
ncbi:MAG TPA: site-2 protease family protein [Methanocella sp.]